ncbi:MAG: transporter substrate-binding domain-containing protein [Burkholderiaceae bacterium]|jgi:polar amino acid transport system substrate-binding protein
MTNRREFVLGLGGAALAGWQGTSYSQSNSGIESAWARIARTKTMRIGAVAGAPPYYRKDIVTGAWQGFMIDFANDLAAQLKVQLDIHETTWGNAVPDLESNKIDIFFGLNPSPQRALVVDFSDPLFNNAFVLLARKDFSATTWESLNRAGFKVSVDLGSSHDQMISRTCPNASITRLESSADATLALQSGRVDAQVLVIILALSVLKKSPGLGHIVVPTPLQSTTTNIGFRKEDDKTWQNYVNQWVAQTRASGKVRQIVLANLDKLGGVKADEIPDQISF